MIAKFQRKFIAVAVLSLSIILLASFGGIVLAMQYRNNQEINEVLQILISNKGQLPQNQARKHLGPDQNKDSLFRYRYFSVFITNKGQVKLVDNTHISTVNKQNLKTSSKQIKQVAKSNQDGQLIIAGTNFNYKVKKVKSGLYICFLDTNAIRANARRLLNLALLIGFSVLIFFTLILILLSKQAIKPVIDAYNKQRRFITNAGHELKTPIAIISANTEMQEMIGKGDEWTESTKEQTQRLTMLINQLISLARIGEQEKLILERVNFSEVSQKAAKSFKSLIQRDGKSYYFEIEPNLIVNAEKRSLLELINILIDNANKYCDVGGKVEVLLKKKWNTKFLSYTAVLEVKNSYQEGKNINLKRFFERFYRQDESHNNSDKSGFGIGLSMAQDLVQIFGGKLSASYENGMVVMRVSLRLKK
ncbi:sensor histidine kinase [Lactobacillus psittaci]|uniref:histidine kinase n=1 Tax=Lactobacillus psittaci DSM 15354 TaxID=1122152 RepID=A0A0R1S9R1_9LACO|nr:HAMP domain-containing sensor histidine kinase [Lactobacillus psittaci]KRL63378.1 signal transduction histidine kinase [Lactobacillus psittaci DSM 15354]